MPGAGQAGDPDAYSGVLATQDLPALHDSVFQLSTLLELDLKPQLASRVRRAFFKLLDDLKLIARDIAAHAQAEILKAEVSSRVRPDTAGSGGARLEDFLGQSHPLDAVPGSVGVNFEPDLYQNVPWWWTNEEGYSGHIGRVVHGYFYDAGFTNRSAPDAGQTREHPLFRAEGPQASGHVTDDNFQPASGGGVRPPMTIQNPIPARRFVEDGYAAAQTEWHARIASARATFTREVDVVLATAQAAVRRP